MFDFLVQFNKEDLLFSDFLKAETQESLTGTRPDLTLYFKNNKEYYIEVKDKNSALTDSEKLKDNRHVFLIPNNYREDLKKQIPTDHILYWEALFKKIDDEFNGLHFPELKVTKETLGIKGEQIMTLDTYKAKVYEVMTKLLSMNKSISISVNRDIWKDFDTLPEDMEEDGYTGIKFNYQYVFPGEKLPSFKLWFGVLWFCKYDIQLDFNPDFTDKLKDYDNILEDHDFSKTDDEGGERYRRIVITQNDFWKKSADELSLIFNENILHLQLTWNEIQLRSQNQEE